MGGVLCKVCGLGAKEIHFHLLSIRKQHIQSLYSIIITTFVRKVLPTMELRVVELAHQRGLTMPDIAKKVGISRVNLSNSLNGNPTLSRLSEVAKILELRSQNSSSLPQQVRP